MQHTDPSNIYVSIMAGGVGSRFWPASRNARPKQFLDMLGIGKSLIRLTFERFQRICPDENIFVVTNQQYRDLVAEHIPELSPAQIVCEPSRNNTAPCVAYAAFKTKKLNPNATMIVAPSDHLITDETAFKDYILQAVHFADQNDALLTLGMRPHQPHTGYGYIKYASEAISEGIHSVEAFTEKPDQATAAQFLASGNYLWNAGIFIWKAASVLDAYAKHASEIHEILQAGWEQYNTPQEQAFINQAYPTTPSISVDYAIMEKADNVYTVPAEFGWSDLGTWASIYQIQEKDPHQNVVSQCQTITIDTENSVIHGGDNKLVVVKGLKDYIVIDDDDVLLIFPKSDEQEIKKVTKQLKQEEKGHYL